MPTATAQAGQDVARRPKRCCASISTTRTRRSATTASGCKQCEALREYAIAEDIREILRQEQEHQIDLATALGEDVPDVSRMPKKKK